MLDYIYANQSEQFSYYRIPKMLFTDNRYKGLSASAKVLYGLLLDRVSLSVKNGWIDSENRVYIIFATVDVMEALNCGEQKVTALYRELESKVGLIERKRQGLGKPSLIYVKNFAEEAEPRESLHQNRENHGSASTKNKVQEPAEITVQEPRKSRGIKNNINNLNHSDLNSIHSEAEREYEANRAAYENYLNRQLQFDVLCQEYPFQVKMLEEIKSLIMSILLSDAPTIRVRKQDTPTAVVKSQMMKLEADHIRMVLEGMIRNKTDIKDIRQYLLTTIYNAPDCIDMYYQARVNHDMAAGRL